MSGGATRLRLDVQLLCAVFLLFQVLLSAAVSSALIEEKLYNHTAARLFSIVCIFALPYLLLKSDRGAALAFRLGATASMAFCALLLLYDYARLNGLAPLPPIPHIGASEELDATFRAYIFRARGGNFEPGHDAAAFAAILPLAASFFIKRFQLPLIITACLPIYLVGYSASLVLWLVTFIIAYGYFEGSRQLNARLLLAFRIGVTLAIATIAFGYFEIVDDLREKFLSASFVDRLASFDAIFLGSTENLKVFLFGYGPGGYLVLDVSLVANTLAGILLDLGAIGLGLFIVMIFASFMQLRSIGNSLYTAAFLAYLLVFWNAIGNYWYPFHWLLLSYPIFARIVHHQEPISTVRSTRSSPHRLGA